MRRDCRWTSECDVCRSPNKWHDGCFEARRCSIDAVVLLVPPDNRLSQSGTLLSCEALEAAGVPVFTMRADMVDAHNRDRDAAGGLIVAFLRQKAMQ
jgi:hypothetical protein